MNRLFISLFFVSFFTVFSFADIIHVPADQLTIQAGIDTATNGDTVLVAEGAYFENINFKGKAITVASLYVLDQDTSHISNTIIDGSRSPNPDTASVVTFYSNEDTTSVLYGFTITGGSGTLVQSEWFGEEYIEPAGGGILCYNAGATISNNKITGNHITSTDFANGGGIAAYPNFSKAYVKIENNQITNNTITAHRDVFGSAIVFTCNGIIKNNTISHNQASSNTTYATGALSCFSQPLRMVKILNNDIFSNSASGRPAIGGGIEMEVGISATIDGNRISNNTLSGLDAQGGGIFMGWITGKISIINNIINGNNAKEGGGIYTFDHRPQIINNTIVNNTASLVNGGGIKSLNTRPVILNTIIWGNTAPTGAQLSGSFDIAYSNIEGASWQDTSKKIIVSNPSFSNHLSFELEMISGCIGSGADSIEINGQWYYSPLTDYDGDFRSMPKGSNPDIGAQEHPDSIATSINEREIAKSLSFNLQQNYPNPFNPKTMISYKLPQTSDVELSIYNLLGQKVATLVSQKQTAGSYEVKWEATGFASGVYLYKLKTGSGYEKTRKLVLLK